MGYVLRMRGGAQALLRTSILNSSDGLSSPFAVKTGELKLALPR